MSKPIIYLIGFLVFIGCGAFVYGITQVCVISWPLPTDNYKYEIPPFLSSLITSIAAVLSTNLGAVLGITITNPSSEFKLSRTWNPLNFFVNPTPTNIQTIACYIYIIALLAASVVWAHRDFESDTSKIVAHIPELTKTLLGVIVGVLAVSLSAPSFQKTNS